MIEALGFRDPKVVERVVAELKRIVTRPCRIMEVCGGQTHSIMRYGLDQLLPREIDLIHGPGCPVCVTPTTVIDGALALAATPGIILCSFGDMLRVPGSRSDLQRVKAQGGDVRVLYSPFDALKLARENPQREIVFLGIGFETTAAPHALTIQRAAQEGLENFSMLTSIVRVPPALDALLSEQDQRVQAILAAGHVCTVMGMHEYPPLVARHRVPIVVTGFEPIDLLEGIRQAVTQLEEGRAELANAYGRAVTFAGNEPAQKMIHEVFEEADCEWRGLGVIPRSGWKIREKYRRHDAATRFPQATVAAAEENECRSGDVLRGRLKPDQCPAFGTRCTPRTPLGATMVSGEGACAAYYHAGKIFHSESLSSASH